MLVAYLGNFSVNYVRVPQDLSSELNFLSWGLLSKLRDFSIWGEALGLTFIATAQTLLTATAVDRLHNFEKTNYNREVIAQGAGNMVSGFLGSLPLCGVIVRSAANIQSGGNSRWSSVAHGVWLLLFVIFLSNWLALIPIATLAAVLVCTGVRLVRLEAIEELKKFGPWELVIYAITVFTVIGFDLLTGILVGFGLSALRLLYNLTHCEIVVEQEESDGPISVCLRGSATFFTLPKLARRLESLPKGTQIEVLVEHLTYIDHACLEQILMWEEEYIARGGRISIAWNHLMGRFNSSPSLVSSFEGPSLQMRAAARQDQTAVAPEGHTVKLVVSHQFSTAKFLDKEIWELAAILPGDTLIAWVERQGSLLIPKGKKRLQELDVMTIVGGSNEIATLKRDFGDAI